MRWYTHLVFAILVALLFKFGLVAGLVCVFASLIPDIDTPKSKVGRKVKVFSWILNIVFGHRRLFHSLFFVGVLSGMIWVFSVEIALGFFVGYFSHLLIDGLNREGIRLFWPFKFKIKGFIKTGSFLEHVLFFVLVVLVYIFLA